LQLNTKLASTMPGASKLLVKPKTSTSAGATKLGGLGMLRKPTTSSSSSTLLKKKGGLTTKTKTRVSKLSMKLPVNGAGAGATTNGTSPTAALGGTYSAEEDDQFEDIEQTRKNVAEAEARAKQEEEDKALAKQLQEEMIINGGSMDAPASSSATPRAPFPPIDFSSTTSPAAIAPTSAPAPAPAPTPSIPKASTKDENLAKLKSMTSDFFAQM